MKKSTREALDAYYSEAGSWAADQLNGLRSSRRIAWWVALGAAAIAIAEAIALMVLMPLKTVVPYTLLVDRTTGFVQALKPLEPNEITPDRALVQSMLVQYVIARESFDLSSLKANYQKAGLWSAGDARQQYLALMQPSNADGPLMRYSRGTVVETRVKSVSRLGEQSALVRFDTIRRDGGGQPGPAQPWVAVVEYRFSGEPMSAEDRFLNPLGFQVTGYRRDPEALTLDEASYATPQTIVPGDELDPIDAVPDPAP